TCSNAMPALAYAARRSASRSRFDARSASSWRQTTARTSCVSRSHPTSRTFGYSPTMSCGRMRSSRGWLGRTAPAPRPYQPRRGGPLTGRPRRSRGLGLLLPALQPARRQRAVGEDELAVDGVDLDLAAVLQAPEEHLVGEDALHLVLDQARHGARAEGLVVAALREPASRCRR